MKPFRNTTGVAARPSFDMEDMISRIKELKKEKNINTEMLSEMCGVPLSTLNKILSGVADSVKLCNAVAIADALEVSLDYLVYGKAENTNNYTLNCDEIEMVEAYRELDIFSRELVRSTIRIEHSRAMQNAKNEAAQQTPATRTPRRAASELSFTPAASSFSADSPKRERRRIDMYDLAVSAGPGQYTGDSSTPTASVSIPVDQKTATADYAVRISGHSMEPKFHDGDILLVERTDTVDVGELCIFTLDNESYFKVYGGDRLCSLNPEFGDIMLGGFETVRLNGRVLGKLKKSTARK